MLAGAQALLERCCRAVEIAQCALTIFAGGVLVSIGAFGLVWGLADDMRKILGVHRRGVQTTATGVGHRTNGPADQDSSETYSPLVSFTTVAGERISDAVLRDVDKYAPPERGLWPRQGTSRDPRHRRPSRR